MLERLKTALAASSDCHASDLRLSTTFDELGLDSLDFLHAIVAVEDEFHCEIPAADLAKMHTVLDLYTWLLLAPEAA